MDNKKKKMNPILFMFIATLVNLAMILIFLVALLVLVSWLAGLLGASDTVYSILLVACFILSFVASFMLYKKFVAWATVKWNVDMGFGQKRR